jgi:hypothetical protein
MVHDTNTSLLSLIDGTTSTNTSDSEDTVIHYHNYQTFSPEAETEAEAEAKSETEKPQSRPSPIRTFHTISTTIKVPLAAPASIDIHPDAPSAMDVLSPTMSREEALAQIRERRGRARSLAQGTLTPRKPIVDVVGLSERRDCSAPTVRSGAVRGRDASRI